MMIGAATLLMAGGCCYEPYPALRTDPIAFGEVPSSVRESFLTTAEERAITSIERTVFHSRHRGFQRFQFVLQDGRTLTFDEHGRVTE